MKHQNYIYYMLPAIINTYHNKKTNCAKQENGLNREMLIRSVHFTVGVCFGLAFLPMASFRQEGNNVLL